MGAAFVTCRSCACLVKREDSACPFCGASIEQAAPVGRATPARASRAAWLAFGPATFASAMATGATCAIAAACNGQIVTESVDAPDGSEAAAPALVEAAAAQVPPAVPEAGVDAALTFGCGTTSCAWPAQFCEEHYVTDSRYRCGEEPPATPYVSDEYRCVDLVVPPVCTATPTCDCVVGAHFLAPPDDWNHYYSPGTCTYSAGLLVRVTEAFSGCGGCYGSPPARLT